MSAGTVTATRKRGISMAWIVGFIVWCVGLWTTTEFLSNLGVPEGSDLMFGAVIQIGLTRLETLVWSGRATMWVWLAFAFDLLMNAGGIWPYTKQFWSTATGAMINDVTVGAFGYTLQAITINAGITVNVGGLVSGIVTFALAALIAYAPEGIWNHAR
jgi:hypothetical protein